MQLCDLQVLSTRSKSPSLAPERLTDVHKRQMAWKTNADARMEAKRAEREREACAECTFTPNKVRRQHDAGAQCTDLTLAVLLAAWHLLQARHIA